ncbi:MAG TPA: CvpA family protein [Candidatus Acidoferrales bacterium]|jgi:uncharacterized membrane protein required for colicin V production|nr:CvpA family protein [Candidatus Acidoferrales bacterium]
MIAALTQSLSTDSLPVNWFDAFILIMLGFGIFRGRKNGMTKEFLPLLLWLAIAITSGLCYALVAQIYNNTCGLDKTWSAFLGYLSITMVIYFIYALVKKTLQPKLTGSNIFGSAEYYLGMMSGFIRYACIVIFFMALINAKYYTPAEIAAKKAYNARWYGGGMYSGDYIPDLHSLQEAVYKKSFSGPYIKQYIGMFLIETGPDTGGGGGGAPSKQPTPVIHIGT